MNCGCGGDCCKQTDSTGALLSGLSGLMGDLGPIHQGANFWFGAELEGASVVGDLISTVESKIRLALEDSDFVWPTSVQKVAGVWNPYIQIEGESSREYGSASHLKKAVSDVIQSLGYRITSGSINFQANTYNPQTGQVTQVTETGANNQSSSNKPNCSFKDQKITDFLACQLGVTTTSAVTIGVVGGLLGAILLVKAIK